MRKPKKRSVARKATPSPTATPVVSLPLDNPLISSLRAAGVKLPALEVHVHPNVVQVWTGSERPLFAVTSERAAEALMHALDGAASALCDAYERTGFAVKLRRFDPQGNEMFAG